MTIAYCETWSSDQMAPVGPLTEWQARERHDHGGLYTVVITDDGDGALRLVERRADGVWIARFVEDHGRDGMIYAFEPTDGRLFLVEASVNVINDAGQTVETSTTSFQPDGTVEARKVDHRDHSVRTTGSMPGNDISMCWEAVPAFGDYDSIARAER